MDYLGGYLGMPRSLSIPQRILEGNLEHAVQAQDIVAETLGPDFFVDIFTFPKNVGVMGDEGVRGHTAVVRNFELEDPDKYTAAHYELLGAAAMRICNETGVVCRVLVDITPEN